MTCSAKNKKTIQKRSQVVGFWRSYVQISRRLWDAPLLLAGSENKQCPWGGSATSSRYSADIKSSSAFLIQQLMISSFIPLFPQDRLREQWQLFLFKNCRILYKNIKRVAGKRKVEVIIKNAPASFPFWERKLCIDENQQIPVTALLRIPFTLGNQKELLSPFRCPLEKERPQSHFYIFNGHCFL